MWNARMDEPQTGIKISGRNINSLRYADDTTLMAGSKKKLKSLLFKKKKKKKEEEEAKEPLHENERGEWKSWLKT